MPSLPSRQTLFLLLALVSLVLVHGITFYSEREASSAIRSRKHTYEALLAITAINERKDHTESLVREYVLTGGEPLAVRAEKNITEVHERASRARQLMGDNPNQVRRLDLLDLKLKALTDRWTSILASRRAQGAEAATKLVADGTGRRMTDEAALILDEMGAEENHLLAERNVRAERFSTASSLTTKVCGVLTLLFGGFAWRALRAATAATRASEESLAITLQSIGDGVLATDAEGRITRLNAVAEQLTGWKHSEALGRPVAEVIHIINETTRQPAFLPVADTLAKGTIHGLANHTLLIARDGTERPIADSCAPIRNRAGEVIGAVLVFRDVTEEHAAQRALRASEAYSRSIIESSPDCLKLLSLDARLTYMAPAGCRIMEVDDFCTLENADWLTFWKGADHEAAQRAIETARNGGAGHFQGFCPTTKGSPRWWSVAISPIPGADGKPEKLLCVSRDITERRQAEQAIRESEERMRLATESADIAVWEWDLKSGMLKWDDRMFAIYGLPSQPEGRGNYEDWRGRVLPDELVEQEAQLQRTVATCGHSQREFRIVRASDQAVRVIHAAEMAVAGVDGRAIRVVGINIDITARKRMEHVVRESEALNRAVLNSMMANIAVVDQHGTIIAINESWERFARENGADAALAVVGVGANYLQVCARAARDMGAEVDPILNGLQGVLAHSQATFKHEYDCHSPTEQRWFAMQVSPLSRAEGGAVIVQVNITERKQAERELEAALRANQLIMQHSLDVICTIDGQGRFDFVSPACMKLWGYQPEELVGRHYIDLVHPDDHPATNEAAAAIMAGRPVLNFENRYRRKDGTLIPVMWSASWSAAEQQMFCVAHDVTERKRVERQMTESRRVLDDFKAALDEHAIVATTDARGKITYVNDKFCAISKYARKELLGQDHRILTSGHHSKTFIRDLWETISSGRVWKGEIKNCAKDGSFYWVDTTIVPFLGADGKPTQYIAIRSDTSKRKLAEETLHQAHQKLSRANTDLDRASRHKDEFLANMSHELRTPLNAILGMSELLTEQLFGPLTPRQAKSVGTIASSGQHLLALINDILDLSKIEAGKMELHPEALNVEELCQSCLAFVRTQAMQKQVHVDHQRDPRPLVLSADPKRCKQILVNLLTNAVKFTPTGGRIGLTVAAPKGEDVVRFTVWDTGIGIAAADQAKLFRAFTQVDSGLNRSQEGTGLGLALVARLAELHGGNVVLESEPGKGSRFIVTLPLTSPGLAPPATAPAPVPVATPVETSHFRRALVVEDDPSAAEQLERYLGELKLTSVVHPRGEGVLETALRERPHVILLDIQLPDESGWVALAKLKEHPQTRDIPVAVISVVDEPGKARSMGATVHLTKPVSREQLATFLHRPFSPKAEAAPRPVLPTLATGPIILLAEDNEANVATLGSYLQAKGYAMHFALNGLIAVKLARELRPALILMDIQMPMMDGLTATRELRADPAFKDTPIIALTALAMTGDRERCLAAGATDYMSKPVKLKELAALVEKLLPRTGEGGGI